MNSDNITQEDFPTLSANENYNMTFSTLDWKIDSGLEDRPPCLEE